MRRDKRWEPLDLICGYIQFVGINTPRPPVYTSPVSFAPESPRSFVYLSPPSPPRRRPRRFTAGQPTPWRAAPTRSTIPPAPRRCSASHHQVRVCDALIQSSILCSFFPDWILYVLGFVRLCVVVYGLFDPLQHLVRGILVSRYSSRIPSDFVRSV